MKYRKLISEFGLQIAKTLSYLVSTVRNPTDADAKMKGTFPCCLLPYRKARATVALS
jgi:hypothetical protein